MTGSGKTGLRIVLLEEALLGGIYTSGSTAGCSDIDAAWREKAEQVETAAIRLEATGRARRPARARLVPTA